jgi:hypothetical protein
MSTAASLHPPGQGAGPAVPRRTIAGRLLGLEHKWLVAIAVIFGLFMAVLDATVVNIALPKWSILIGLVALGIASYLLSGLTLTTPTRLLQLWLIGRSIGIGFASQPASVIALSDVPRAKLARGSSFFTVQRQVASAFVTSFLATYVKNSTIPHYAHLAEQTTQSSPLYSYISGVVGQAAAQGRWTLPVQALVVRQVAAQLRLQATVMAYRDALLMITGFIAVALVLAFFVGNPRGRAGAEIME